MAASPRLRPFMPPCLARPATRRLGLPREQPSWTPLEGLVSLVHAMYYNQPDFASLLDRWLTCAVDVVPAFDDSGQQVLFQWMKVTKFILTTMQGHASRTRTRAMLQTHLNPLEYVAYTASFKLHPRLTSSRPFPVPFATMQVFLISTEQLLILWYLIPYAELVDSTSTDLDGP